MSSRLNIKRNIAIDFMDQYPNKYGVGRIQTTIDGRMTELLGDLRIAYGVEIPATHTSIYQNGQAVDIDTMLMCSRCRTWKHDREFERDCTRKSRRGRAYYCKSCKSKSRLFGTVIDEKTQAKLIKDSRTKKRR